ncbi:unnamed protein product, partial [Brassica oleracea var. botrytis]
LKPLHLQINVPPLVWRCVWRMASFMDFKVINLSPLIRSATLVLNLS